VVFDTGIIETDDGILVIDTPAGVITARAAFEGGAVSSVSFINVPSFVAGTVREIDVKGFGTVTYRLAFGGAFYAFVDVAAIGLTMSIASALVEAGKAIKSAVVQADPISHPLEEDLGFLYGVVFTGPPRNPDSHSSHACVFAEGELDRSPTGTGVSGRLAILHADGQIEEAEEVRIESLIGNVFTGRIVDTTQIGSEPAIIPEVTGTAHITGRSEFWLDPADEIGAGFLLR
jgi:trans-L-3-hydroxyproline dehydratase